MYSYMLNNEENIAKYAVHTNLFRLGSTNPMKKNTGGLLLGGLFIRVAIVRGVLSGAFDLEPF